MAKSKGIKKPRKGKKEPAGQLALIPAVKQAESAPKPKAKAKPKAVAKDDRVLNQVIFKFADGSEQLIKVGEALIKRLKLKVADLGNVTLKGRNVAGGERHQTRSAYVSMGRKPTKKGGLRQHWEAISIPKTATFTDFMYWVMASQNFLAKPGAVRLGRQETTIDQKVRRVVIK